MCASLPDNTGHFTLISRIFISCGKQVCSISNNTLTFHRSPDWEGDSQCVGECDADIMQTFYLHRQASENGTLSILRRDWCAPGRNEVWMWRNVGLTAPWPRTDGRRNGAIPIPQQTARSAGFPHRSLTVPVKPWKLLITIPRGCFMETE